MDKNKIIILLNLSLIFILAFQIIDFNRTKSESQCVELPNGNGPVCRLTEPESSMYSSAANRGCPPGSYLVAIHYACGEDECSGGMVNSQFSTCRFITANYPGAPADGARCY